MSRAITTSPITIRRFWKRVEKTESCWLWTGGLSRSGGRYGTGGYGKFSGCAAHRFAYELLVGPIEPGVTLDHLCEVTRCVNPAHLEPVTTAENTRRYYSKQTSCSYGHEWTDANTRRRGGRRMCRACDRRRQAECKARRAQ